MDIDALTDEVMRRLLKKIRQEQNAPDALGCCGVSSNDSSHSPDSKTGKQVITQDKAASVAPGSKVTYPKGTVITPLARDTFKERNVCVELE